MVMWCHCNIAWFIRQICVPCLKTKAWIISSYQWLSARLQYLHCKRTWDIAVLNRCINIEITSDLYKVYRCIPDSKVHGAYMGPTWVLLDPCGSHVGPMNLAIRNIIFIVILHKGKERYDGTLHHKGTKEWSILKEMCLSASKVLLKHVIKDISPTLVYRVYYDCPYILMPYVFHKCPRQPLLAVLPHYYWFV